MRSPELPRSAVIGGLLFGCSLIALPVLGQTLPVVAADVVVTATATPVPAGTTGRTVLTFSRADLEQLGLGSIIDGLRLLPGVDVKARGSHQVQTDFSLRGATFGQTLVLLDGVRLNDAQSGHHNGEMPTSLVGVDRIEVVMGPGSAVHGADALGGTIQIISRRDRHATGELTVGDHRTAGVQASLSGQWLPAQWTLTGWGSRSDGFMFDRDWSLGGAGLRAPLSSRLTLDVRHHRRVFGANGFYGNSPSKEWTDGTVVSAQSSLLTNDDWHIQARAAYRNHGDRFRWDINRPGFAENTHRTHAADIDATAARSVGRTTRVTLGAGGGGDWIDSSNLGAHTLSRAYGFAEVLTTPTASLSVQSALRVDRYSTFGTAWSPSLSASLQLSPTVRLRASGARAFRVSTYTERYYSDPAHLARPDLLPERGWSVDGGLDLTAGRWMFSASPFVRWDQDVIDWTRQSTADRWMTTNVRDVTTRGIEGAVTGRWSRALLRAHLSWLDVDAPALTVLSKYVLDYAPRSGGVSVAVPVGLGWTLSANIEGRDRFDGQQYALVGARISRAVGRLQVFAEGSNLLDERYREIAGVPMPGRWLSAGISVR
jgi:iron complex outermembrane receptor protein